jgi:hypothetical protein
VCAHPLDLLQSPAAGAPAVFFSPFDSGAAFVVESDFDSDFDSDFESDFDSEDVDSAFDSFDSLLSDFLPA